MWSGPNELIRKWTAITEGRNINPCLNVCEVRLVLLLSFFFVLYICQFFRSRIKSKKLKNRCFSKDGISLVSREKGRTHIALDWVDRVALDVWKLNECKWHCLYRPEN